MKEINDMLIKELFLKPSIFSIIIILAIIITIIKFLIKISKTKKKK